MADARWAAISSPSRTSQIETIGKILEKMIYSRANTQKLPSSTDHSTQVGAYETAGEGKRGRVSVGTTMLYRSNHMPTLIKIAVKSVPFTVRVRGLVSTMKGTMKLKSHMAQKIGENSWMSLEKSTRMPAGSLP